MEFHVSILILEFVLILAPMMMIQALVTNISLNQSVTKLMIDFMIT